MQKIHPGTIIWHLKWVKHLITRGILMRMPNKTWEKHKKKWQRKRTGKCIDCGFCCHKGGSYCKHYDKTAKKGKRCKLQGKNKPQLCKDFPINPTDVKLSNCQGYKFKTTKKQINRRF